VEVPRFEEMDAAFLLSSGDTGRRATTLAASFAGRVLDEDVDELTLIMGIHLTYEH
jgi:hypothetical protein